MIRFDLFKSVNSNVVYKPPKKVEYKLSQLFVPAPYMGKGIAVASDVIDFIAKCKNKLQKLF